MRVRVEILLDDGRLTSMSFEVTPLTPSLKEALKKQIASFLDTVAQCSPTPQPHLSPSSPTLHNEVELTLRERLEMFLKYGMDKEWFTSKDVREAYEKAYGSRLSLSTISTYLSRMYQEGILERGGTRKERKYRVVSVAGEPSASELKA